jgi:hypothetical protein
VEEAIFSPLCVESSFVKDQLAVDACFMAGSSILIHWSLSVFMPIPCCFYCYGSAV